MMNGTFLLPHMGNVCDGIGGTTKKSSGQGKLIYVPSEVQSSSMKLKSRIDKQIPQTRSFHIFAPLT